MGDTVAHAARAPEEPDPQSSTGEHSVDHHHHHHHHASATAANDEAAKRSGENVLSPLLLPLHKPGFFGNRPPDATPPERLSQNTGIMDGGGGGDCGGGGGDDNDAKAMKRQRRRRGGEDDDDDDNDQGDANRSRKTDEQEEEEGSSSLATGTTDTRHRHPPPTASSAAGAAELEGVGADIHLEKSVAEADEEDHQLSLSKDGSSENISSIEIDTSSVGVDLSFTSFGGGASTNPASPEPETGPGAVTGDDPPKASNEQASNGGASVVSSQGNSSSSPTGCADNAEAVEDSLSGRQNSNNNGNNNNINNNSSTNNNDSNAMDYSETSSSMMTESGFVEGCSSSSTTSAESPPETTVHNDKMENSPAAPPSAALLSRQGDSKAMMITKEGAESSVTSRDQEDKASSPSSARTGRRGSGREDSVGIPRAPFYSMTKTNRTMEEEVEFLRQEVRQQASHVQRLQTSLYDQQTRANVAMVALRTQLRHKDRAMQHVKGQHEQRMSALLSHLLYLEGQMRQEQRHVLELLHEKDDVIRRQKSAIEDLASKNARLLAALKEVHGYSGGNGISTPQAAAGAGSSESGDVKSVLGTPVVLRNKDKGQKVRFGSVKDKLRRHKSSLELHRPASLDTLVEGKGTLRYGSQENLSHTGNILGTSPGRRTSSEGLCSDELKKSRQQERKERCRSLIDYPFRLNDLPEVSSEVERGRDEPPSPTHHLSDPLLLDAGGRSARTASTTSSSSSCSQLFSPGARGSLYSDEDEVLLGSSPRDGATGGKPYGELAKSVSMPQSLASASASSSSPSASPSSSSHSNQEAAAAAGVKERPHSLSGVELSLNMDKMTMMPMEKVSMNPSPTSQVPPGGSESNPFKSFKNVFRRRNSKQRSKKRPASLGQQTNAEYHEALKEHFKKYDLN